jgi:microcystin-dependent protein
MQEFNKLATTEAVNVYLPKLDNNVQSVASNFSGTSFPTSNLLVGMVCTRTDDNNNRYQLISDNPVTWQLLPSKSYVDSAVKDAVGKITTYTGATSTANGTGGLVPAPTKGQQDTYYLSADGTWKQVQQRTIKQVIDIVHPVGSIWETTTTDDPNVLWSGTTWVQMDAGRVLVSAGTYTENGTKYTYNLGDKGGEAKHQLTTGELASHNHNASVSVSIGYAGNHNHTVTLSASSNEMDGYYNFSKNATDSNETYTTSTAGNHTHSASANASIGYTGDNTRHENRMPYVVVNRWKRTA